jgi:hypothetical protein
MSDAVLIQVAIVAFFGGLAAVGVLVSAAKEKDRLWNRYQQIKAKAVYEQQVREKMQREKRRVAQKANLAEDVPVIQPDPQ